MYGRYKPDYWQSEMQVEVKEIYSVIYVFKSWLKKIAGL